MFQLNFDYIKLLIEYMIVNIMLFCYMHAICVQVGHNLGTDLAFKHVKDTI